MASTERISANRLCKGANGQGYCSSSGKITLAPCPLRETRVHKDSAAPDNEVEEISKALEQKSWMK
jgi:hypothetical protein